MNRFYVICFDIADDRIRRKVVKALENKGQRVQKSVFECFLNDKQYIELKTTLDNLIDKSKDSVRYYHLCENCRIDVRITGVGFYSEDEKLIII